MKDIYVFILSKWYFHFWVGMKYAYLYNVIFKLFNIYNMIKSLYTPFFIAFLKITIFYKKNYRNIGGN